MLIVLSPAKNLDVSPVNLSLEATQPVLIKDTESLAKQCKKLSPADLSTLMGISDKLAILNAERFSSFTTPFTTDNAKPAMLTFNGDVYSGLEASTMSDQDLAFSQQHIRILSGLYGVLKPLDLMQAYRLEMGTKLANSRGDNLYQYWGSKIAQVLNSEQLSDNDSVIVNLASNEYFKAVDKQVLTARVITPVFKDQKKGILKVISFYAKKARGLMARYMVDNRITNPEHLKQFDSAGYTYSAALSKGSEWVFTRPEQ
jgi:hypothetical protein